MNCPSKYKIAIKRVFYGVKEDRQCQRLKRSQPECCERTQGDCVEHNSKVYITLNGRCSGDVDCHYDVKAIETDLCKTFKKSVTRLTDYMTVVYDCVPDTDIAQFCSNDIKKGKLLYLSNMNYPDPISKGRQSCQCLIKTEFSRGIAINVIDIMFSVPQNTDICPQRLRITDTYTTRSLSCGQSGMFGFRNIYTRMVSNVTTALESNVEKRRGYVWIQFKAQSVNDYVMVYCGTAMEKLLYGYPLTTPQDTNVTVSAAGLSPKIIPDMSM
ncbi:hypothetical protein FSP39_016250 [Pinctada imbricata]|uniref:SUEL-type lectin domain-containing protein n=1 Tax=Pinctada imbricata TaxID=66713 RepID=A0AA89C7K4_PINIB|nr:hypothetical protein FSP39_016250 [Pinctada imbricata]